MAVGMATFRDEIAANRAAIRESQATNDLVAGPDLLGFLSDVLPPNGPVYFGAYVTEEQSWHHVMARSVDQLAEHLISYDNRGYEVYFAPAGFAEEGIAGTDGKIRRRVRENARFVRACWIDIDVGSDKAATNKGYESLDSALGAIKEFCIRIGNNPTYLISSGTGLHCYWTFPLALSVSDWDRISQILKRACVAGGLICDPARTADVASVMRPVDTCHRKDRSSPRVVSILERGLTVDPQFFTARLTELALEHSSAEPNDTSSTIGKHTRLTEWFYALPQHAQLSVLDDACSAVPDSVWSSYDSWITIIAAIRGIRGVNESQLLDLLGRHSARSPKWFSGGWTTERLREKFLSFRGGSTIRLFEMAERNGWHPRQRHDSTPFESHERAAAERYFTERFIYVTSQHMYLDTASRQLISPAALDESQSFLTRQLSLSPRQILRVSQRTLRTDGLGYNPAAGITYEEYGRQIANRFMPWLAEEIEPTAEELDLWNWFIDGQLFAGANDQTAREYFLNAIAYPLQNSGHRVASVPLLIGAEGGTGKSTLTETVPRLLFGATNVSTATQAEIESSFNDWQAESQILCLPEIWIGGHRDAEKLANRLKDSVTNPIMRVHPKGLKGYSQPNRTTILATSNYENAVVLRDGDRRWGIHVTNAQKMAEVDARKLYGFLNSPRAPGVLRHIFMARDLANFNPFGEPPLTEGKTLVIAASRSDAEDAALDAWINKDFPFDRDLVLLEEIREVLATSGIEISLRKIGDFLRRPPINATRLPGRPRLRANRQGAGDLHCRHYNRRSIVWAVRNANAWRSASESAISRHFAEGTPPVAQVTPQLRLASTVSLNTHPASTATDTT